MRLKLCLAELTVPDSEHKVPISTRMRLPLSFPSALNISSGVTNLADQPAPHARGLPREQRMAKTAHLRESWVASLRLCR